MVEIGGAKKPDVLFRPHRKRTPHPLSDVTVSLPSVGAMTPRRRNSSRPPDIRRALGGRW